MSKSPGPGHNSAVGQTDSHARLRSIVDRIERLEEEKKELASDIKDIYIEAKSAGFDSKVLRLLIRQRKRPKEEVEAEMDLLDTYTVALGM